MTQKTPQEEEDERRRKQQEDAASIQDRVKNGFMDMINPAKWDWGSMGIGLLFVVGLYFFARTDFGKDLLKKFIDPETVDNIFAKGDVMIGGLLGKVGIHIPGMGMDAINSAKQARDLMKDQLPANLVDFLAKDDATWNKNKALIKETGGDLADPGSYDKLITGLVAKPEGRDLLRGILQRLPADGGEDKGGVRKNIMSAIQKIVSTDAVVPLLADPEQRKLAMEAISQFSPIKFDATKLDQFVQTVGMKDGAPTPALRQFLSTAFTPNDQGVLPVSTAFATFLANPELSADPATKNKNATAIRDLMASVQITPDLDAGTKTAVQLMRYNSAPLMTLFGKLGPEKAEQFMALVNAPATNAEENKNKTRALTGFIFDGANADAFSAFVGTVDSGHLPPELKTIIAPIVGHRQAVFEAGKAIIATGTNPIDLSNEFLVTDAQNNIVYDGNKKPQLDVNKTLGHLLSADDRAALRQMGTGNIAALATTANPMLSQRNLDAMLKFGDAIDTNPANQQRAEQTGIILSAISELVVNHNPVPFGDLDAKALAAFFRDEQNKTAMNTLLHEIDAAKIPDPKARAQFVALRDHWRDAKGHGIGEVMADDGGANMVRLKVSGHDIGAAVNFTFNPLMWANKGHLDALGSGAPATPPKPQQQAMGTVTVGREFG